MPHLYPSRLVVLAALLLGGCAAVAPSAAPQSSPSATSTASTEPLAPPCAGWVNAQGRDPTTPEQLANAVRFRQEMGLSSDLELVRQMACRPDANVDFDVPLTPAEIAEFGRRTRDGHAIQGVVQPYADQHGDEFGGLYIDQSRGGVVTVLWTGHLVEHEAAIRARLDSDAPIAFRRVRWSERELGALLDRVTANWDWMNAIGAAPQSASVDIIENVVEIAISSANPEAAALIVAHYGAPPGMLRVVSDGTGAALLPWGTVKGRVVTRDGRPPGENSFTLQQRPGGPPGSCGGGDAVGGGVQPNGDFEYPCQVGIRIIEVVDMAGALPHPVVGRARVEVAAEAVVFVEIVIDEPAQP